MPYPVLSGRKSRTYRHAWMTCSTLMLLSLSSCSPVQYSSEDCRALSAPKAYLQRCLGGNLNGPYVGDLRCWPFSKRQRVRGVWVTGFETSIFYPGVSTSDQLPKAKSGIWLLNAAKEQPQILQKAPTGTGQNYYIDAEARMSLCDASFGHSGAYPREIIIEKIYSVRPATY